MSKIQVIRVFQQNENHTEDVDLIEYEPEEEESEVIYEYVELENQNNDIKNIQSIYDADDKQGLYQIIGHTLDETKFRCSNRACKRNNIVFDTKEEKDAHYEFHEEQYRSNICPICNKELANAMKLKTHMELRHTPRQFTCDQCGKIFRSKDNLRLHMTHHRKYFYVECKACSRGYKSIQSLRYHLRQHFEHHQCDQCGRVFEHKKLLLGHVAAMHNQELQVQCRYCTRMFARSDVRDAHEREIHKNGMIGSHFRCTECDQSFDLRDELMSHKILNHFSGVIHTCEECGKNFKKKSLLDLHMNVHRKKNISCDVCKQLFTFVTGLNKHKKLGRCKGPPSETLADRLTKEEIARIAKQQLIEITVNPKKVDAEDGECEDFRDEPEEAAITIKKDITVRKKPGRKPKIHAPVQVIKEEEIEIRDEEDAIVKLEPPEGMGEIITSSSGRIIKRKLPTVIPQLPYRPANIHKKTNIPFMCDICGVNMESKVNLLSHLNSHVRDKKHKCNSCEKTFCNVLSLKIHYARAHEKTENPFKEKKFACDTCDKRYLTKHLLGIHKKSHDNLREYKCQHDDCTFETNSPYDLNNHVKRIHNPDKPFECPKCDKKFKRRCDMENHRTSVHSEVRTYVKCPVCTKIILERGLQSHMINRHSEKAQFKPFECSICGKRERYERALQRHYDSVHEPKNRGVIYQCPDCPASFYRRRDANIHSFEHYRGEIFECNVCSNKYKTKKELTNHEYTHRSTEYPCPYCKKIFQTKSGRGKHVKKHNSGSFEKFELLSEEEEEDEIVYEEYEILDGNLELIQQEHDVE